MMTKREISNIAINKLEHCKAITMLDITNYTDKVYNECLEIALKEGYTKECFNLNIWNNACRQAKACEIEIVKAVTFEKFKTYPVENDSENVWVDVDDIQASIKIGDVITGEENTPFEASYILEGDTEHEAWEMLYEDYKNQLLSD